MEDITRQELIDRYKAGAKAVADALTAVGESGLDRRPAPGDWTAREVVHHLADSETMSAIRLRRLLAEEAPVLGAYDEVRFARVLHYDRPIDASLALFKAVRAASAELVDRLSAGDWTRTGTHSESGPYSVETWLETYAAHAFEHADQIRKAGAIS